jgi:uncharacterized membrane protein YtjA (UPF0391 family)
MFSGAVLSLIVAVIAAVVGYGGLPDATAATIAQHVFLIGIGLFVVNAVVAILEVELPQGLLAPLTRGGKVETKAPSFSDML